MPDQTTQSKPYDKAKLESEYQLAQRPANKLDIKYLQDRVAVLEDYIENLTRNAKRLLKEHHDHSK